MNIFNIGKANERITALETELATTKTELTTAEENSTAIENAAAALKTERDDNKSKLDAETKAHTTTKASLTAKDSEIATLKAAQTDFEAKVEKAASAKALQITAALGVPPVTITPVADPAVVKVDTSKMTPREKIVAAFTAQTAAKGVTLIAK